MKCEYCSKEVGILKMEELSLDDQVEPHCICPACFDQIKTGTLKFCPLTQKTCMKKMCGWYDIIGSSCGVVGISQGLISIE
jgi:hypothetical protein